MDIGNEAHHEIPQVHFYGTKAALNIDGTWKHGKNAITLTNAQKEFLLEWGWKLP